MAEDQGGVVAFLGGVGVLLALLLGGDAAVGGYAQVFLLMELVAVFQVAFGGGDDVYFGGLIFCICHVRLLFLYILVSVLSNQRMRKSVGESTSMERMKAFK